MLKQLISTLLTLAIGVAAIGLFIALFFIGIVALWYFMLIAGVIWLVRSVYTWWLMKNAPPVTRDPPRSERQGRIIDNQDD